MTTSVNGTAASRIPPWAFYLAVPAIIALQALILYAMGEDDPHPGAVMTGELVGAIVERGIKISGESVKAMPLLPHAEMHDDTEYVYQVRLLETRQYHIATYNLHRMSLTPGEAAESRRLAEKMWSAKPRVRGGLITGELEHVLSRGGTVGKTTSSFDH